MIDLQKTIAFLAKGIDGKIEALEGGYRIGHTPHVAPMAYFHRFYPGLDEAQLAKVNTEWPVRIPDDYARFLRVTNGVRLFAGVLSLNGYLHSLSRSIEGLGRPVDLRYGTIIKEIDHPDDTDFGIGCLVGHSQKLHLIMSQDGQIDALNQSSETVRTWANFATFWDAELARLSPFFDRTGRAVIHKDDLLVFDRQ